MRAIGAEHVLVMAKAPVAGRVKTRLCPPCSPAEAAAVAEAALVDTLEAVAGCGAARKVVALDGAPGPWLPPGFEVVAQRGNGLAERLAAAWSDTGGPGVQIGMDTPQLQVTDLDRLLGLLGPGHAALGPARDGGWWAIALPPCDPVSVFADVPMSSSRTGAAQLRRLRRMGLEVTTVEERTDIDTVDDLLAVSAAAPGTRTAAVVRRIGLMAASE